MKIEMIAVWMTMHLLGVILWIGGMFFAHMVLRPSVSGLEVKQRLHLLSDVLKRFFCWVWVSIVMIFVSGYAMIFNHFGGMKAVGIHIHIMQTIAIIMLFIFLYVFFASYPKLKRALQADNIDDAAKAFKLTRILIAANLHLGLITVIIGSAGRYPIH